ncbi:unnamed protein product [Sphagnum troendelagicum]|uniref:RNA helicase n=1 Tax=Sphagnum troendelagicum TaxID=128251 RepID=A0ABP0UCQ8_9BRYO
MMSEALVASNANLFMVGLRKSPTTSSFEKQSQLQLPNPFVFKFHSTNLSRFITPTAAAAAATNRNSQAGGGGRSSSNSSRGYSSTDSARYKDSYDKQRRNGIQDHYSRSTSSSSSSSAPSYSFCQKTDRQKTQEEAEDHQRRTFGKRMELPDDESRDSRKTFRNSSGYGNSGGRYDDGNVQEGGNSSSYNKSSKGGGSGRYRGSLKAGYDANYRGSSRSNSVNPDQRSSRSSRHRRRRYPDKGLPKGMYEMVDNETGEKVFVWGTEDEELPVPTPADLKWEYTKTAISGDVSDESWYKAMEASMGGASGAFSVKGVRQGEVTEGDETQRHRKMDRKDHQEPSKDREPSVATKSNFLDDLRIQTHRKLGSGPSPPPESLKTMNAKLVMRHEGSLESLNSTVDKSHPQLSKASGDDDDTATFVVKPRGMRDLNARSNFDPRLTDEYFGSKSFKDVGASEEVIKALTSLQVMRPSAIQAMAFKPVLEGQSCIIADQTGSGKTLAYVAPLVQSLRNEEANGAAKALSKKPRVLVLVPTSELAVQVLNVCRAVSKGGAPFRSIILTGGFKWKTQVESLVQGAEIVVATPGRFLQHLQSGTLQLNNLKCVVLDEVDILYDDEEFLEVLQTVEQAAAKHVQYVHVTATLPVDIHDSLLSRYPDSVPLMGPSLHRTAVGLQEILVDCSGAEGEEKTPEAAFVSKRTALLQLVDERPVSKTIVFCNKIETCRKVENALARHDRNETKLVVLPYHAALSQQARLESMQQFLESKPKKNMFLVCTDRASRGLDSFDVEHVVLFDFPRDPSEYVRRVGRTARGAGGTGKVFVFALGKQVAMARRIMARNEKGHPVHSVPGSQYET